MIQAALLSGTRTSDIEELIDNSSTKYAASVVYNMDCIAGMKHYPDKFFDLAVVDPPYGIGESGGKNRRGKSRHERKNWDTDPPSQDYFDELFRVSRNQIIWGANYFIDKIEVTSMGWVCWDKKLDNSDFSDFELAFTSFNRAAKIFRYSKNGGSRTPAALKDIIHPTQKPIKLYDWIFKHYADRGQRIIDTHLGSGSSRIAANKAGLDFTGFEIDEDYFNDSEDRFKKFISQTRFF